MGVRVVYVSVGGCVPYLFSGGGRLFLKGVRVCSVRVSMCAIYVSVGRLNGASMWCMMWVNMWCVFLQARVHGSWGGERNMFL